MPFSEGRSPNDTPVLLSSKDVYQFDTQRITDALFVSALNQIGQTDEVCLRDFADPPQITLCKPLKMHEIKKLKKGLYNRIKLCYIF